MKANKSYHKGYLCCVLVLVLIICSTTAFGDTILVPADEQTIQAAIDVASVGDTVLVADGTYTGVGNKDLDFKGKAITVQSENGSENCIIDCEDEGRGFDFHSGEQEDSVVSGFTITNAFLFGQTIGWDNGGCGIRCFESSPTITKCTISANSAAYCNGAGIYCSNSSPVITNCTISENSSYYEGGGIYCSNSSPIISNCTITGNWAQYGAGIYCSNSSPIVTNCTISGNVNPSFAGGGMYCSCSSSPIINNCIFWANSPNEIYVKYSCPIFTFSDIQGGYVGESNIDADPLFVDSENGDYHLTPSSPCIDIGTSEGAPDTDIDGDSRHQGAGYDIGADEYPSGPPVQPNLSVVPSSYDFGSLAVGKNSSAQSFIISNTGQENIEIGTISITGTDASEFSLQNDNCSGQTLLPSKECTVDIVFVPTSSGSKSSYLTIPSSDPDVPELTISLSGTGAGVDSGYLAAPDLWLRAVINTVEKGPINAVWKKGGEDTTSAGDRVIWGHFYASPNDVTWGSQNNPDLFVKIWFDVSGRVDVNFFHVSVPDIEVYSDYPYDGMADEHGTTTMNRRYIRQYYENGQSHSDENYEDGNPPSGYTATGNPSGYSTINDLRIGSIINTVEKDAIDAVWRLGGQDTTSRGDQVLWGHFYASPSDVTWGSENNPDLFVKIWFDVSGRTDVNFFHVSVPHIEVYSDLPSDATYDQQGITIMENRYIRHEYWR